MWTVEKLARIQSQGKSCMKWKKSICISSSPTEKSMCNVEGGSEAVAILRSPGRRRAGYCRSSPASPPCWLTLLGGMAVRPAAAPASQSSSAWFSVLSAGHPHHHGCRRQSETAVILICHWSPPLHIPLAFLGAGPADCQLSNRLRGSWAHRRHLPPTGRKGYSQ